jgi:hypothetical protein
MDVPQPVQRHPNATFVLGSTPLVTLVLWVAGIIGVTMPQYVAAAVATVIVSALLVGRRGIQNVGAAIWTYGIAGCCRRIWKGSTP